MCAFDWRAKTMAVRAQFCLAWKKGFPSTSPWEFPNKANYMRHTLCQVLKHGDEPSNCESSCPCFRHNQISTSTTTSLKHLLFLLLHIKFYEKQISLINKLQPLSYQFTSNITPRLPLHAHLNQPPKYATLLQYSHIPNTRKKLHTPLVHWRPNIRSHSVLSLSAFAQKFVETRTSKYLNEN